MTQGRSRTARTTSPVSAIDGISLGGTKLPTSISGIPAAAIALIQPILISVGMRVLAICSPSRGPTSHTVTHSPMFISLRFLCPASKSAANPHDTVA